MNQVVISPPVQPDAPVLTLFQHLDPRLAGWRPRALRDAFDVGVADNRRELAAGDLSAADEFNPRFILLSSGRSDCVGRETYLIGAWGETLPIRHKASSELDGTQHRRRRRLRRGDDAEYARQQPGNYQMSCYRVRHTHRHCTLTTRTARRFSRRVSSRALSYF